MDRVMTWDQYEQALWSWAVSNGDLPPSDLRQVQGNFSFAFNEEKASAQSKSGNEQMISQKQERVLTSLKASRAQIGIA